MKPELAIEGIPGTERVQPLADILRSGYVVIATKPVPQLQICTTRGHPYHCSKLHPGPRSSVGMWRGTDRHTDTYIDARDQHTFRVVYDSREM